MRSGRRRSTGPSFSCVPLQADLAVLNQGRGGDSNLAMVSAKDGFDAFVRNLESESMRRKFFEAIYLPALTEQQRSASRNDLYTRFLASVSVGALSGENPGDVSVRMEAEDPVRSGEWASLYAAFAGSLAGMRLFRTSLPTREPRPIT